MPEQAQRLAQISGRLEELAAALRAGAGGEEATRLADECAELASEAATELERLARASTPDAVPGQEELL